MWACVCGLVCVCLCLYVYRCVCVCTYVSECTGNIKGLKYVSVMICGKSQMLLLLL